MRQKGRLSTVWGVLLLALTLSAPLQAGKKPSKVALAIVIDEATYNATAASVQRYADAVVRYNRKPVEIHTTGSRSKSWSVSGPPRKSATPCRRCGRHGSWKAPSW